MKVISDRRGRFVFSGALAGAASALIFTFLHDILISDIWFSLALMLIAGAICGACLGWSYTVLVGFSSLRSWIGYNLLCDAMFVVLGLASVLVFTPVTPMAALMALNGPPNELIAQAMPLTVIFTVIAAVTMSMIYGFRWTRLGAALLTSSVLVLLLGLNVSVIGLVSIPRGSWILVAEMLGLILVLNLAYISVFIALERNSLLARPITEQGTVV